MNFLKRLHREESAQISFLAVAGIVCFVGLLSMVINTNDIVGERVHMQDVADTTALSAASWTARGLNTIAFVNVMNAKLATTAVLINSLKDTIPVIQAIGNIQLAIFQGCSGVPFIGPFCAAMAIVVQVQLRALDYLKSVVNPMANNLSKCPGGALWKMMKGLQALATGVRSTFGAIGIAESISIAQANGATFGVVVNGELTDVKGQLMLPVKDTKFADHCPHITNGGPGFELQGYSCNQGPLKIGRERINKTILIPFTTLVAHPVFKGMVARHNKQIGCTNPPGEEDGKVPVTLKNLEQCREYDVSARWAHVWSKTSELTDGSLQLRDFVPWRPRNQSNQDGDGDDAKDLGELERELVEAGLPTGGAGSGTQTQKALGRGNQFIPKANEQKRDIIFNDRIGCRNPRYPSYIPPLFNDWEAEIPGQVRTFDSCIGCKRIDRWNEFTWVSGQHVINSSDESTGGYFLRVDKRTIEPPEEEKNGVTKYVYIVEAVTLVDAGEKEMTQKEFDDYLKKEGQQGVNTEGTKSSTGCDKPIPYMLDKGTSQSDKDKFEAKLRFIGVIYKDIGNEPPFWSGFYDQPPKRLITYAQAQVYNYLSEDTFTQDWRVRLEQANLLKDFMENGPGSALGGFGTDMLDAVNNH